MAATRTIRRDALRRMAERGELVYVGGYSFDDMTGADTDECRAEPRPVVYWPRREEEVGGRTRLVTPPYDNRTVYLRHHEVDDGVRVTEDTVTGVIHLRIHSNCSMDFMRRADWEARHGRAVTA